MSCEAAIPCDSHVGSPQSQSRVVQAKMPRLQAESPSWKTFCTHQLPETSFHSSKNSPWSSTGSWVGRLDQASSIEEKGFHTCLVWKCPSLWSLAQSKLMSFGQIMTAVLSDAMKQTRSTVLKRPNPKLVESVTRLVFNIFIRSGLIKKAAAIHIEIPGLLSY